MEVIWGYGRTRETFAAIAIFTASSKASEVNWGQIKNANFDQSTWKKETSGKTGFFWQKRS